MTSLYGLSSGTASGAAALLSLLLVSAVLLLHALTDTATARDALSLITEAPYGIIPIVTAEGIIAGIVTRGSLLTAFAAQWGGVKEEEMSI